MKVSEGAGGPGHSPVSLQDLLRACLTHSERTFSKRASNPLSTRRVLMRNLTEIRILLARLLTIFRWNKSTNISDKIVSFLETPEIQIRQTASQIENFFQYFPLNELKNTYQVPDLKIPTRFPVNPNHQIALLLNARIPSRIRQICVTGNKVYFIAPDKYQFCLGVGKYGRIRIISYSYNWPKGIPASEKFVQLLSKKFSHMKENNSVLLSKIDRLLNSSYMHGVFLNIERTLMSKQTDYPMHVCRMRDGTITFEFCKSFEERGKFKMFLSLGRIFVVGCAPLINAPDEHTFEYSRYVSNEDETNMICQLIGFEIPPDVDLNSLLGELYSIVVYNYFNNLKRIIMRALLSVSLPYFGSKCEFFKKKASLTRLNAFLASLRILSIRINSETGSSIIEITTDPQTSSITEVEFDDPETIYLVISSAFTNIALNAATKTTLNQEPHLGALFERGDFAHTFSFAPDFALTVSAENGHPKMMIMEKATGMPCDLPSMIELKEDSILRAWIKLPTFLTQSKQLLFLIQTQLELKKLKILSNRYCDKGPKLEISISSGMVGILSPVSSGWEMILRPHSYKLPSKAQPIMKIYSKNLDARAAEFVSKLIDVIRVWTLTQFHVIEIADLSDLIIGVEQEPLSNVVLKLADNKFIILLSGIQKIGMRDDHHVYYTIGNTLPKIECRLSRNNTKFHIMFKYLMNDKSTFQIGSFIHHSLLAYLQFMNAFYKSNDWTFFFEADRAIRIIFKSRYTLFLHLQSIHKFHMFTQSQHLFFALPINYLIKVNHAFCARFPLKELPEIKRLIEEFYMDYETFIKKRYTFIGMDPTAMLFERGDIKVSYKRKLFNIHFANEKQTTSHDLNTSIENICQYTGIIPKLLDIFDMLPHEPNLLAKLFLLLAYFKQRVQNYEIFIKSLSTIQHTPIGCMVVLEDKKIEITKPGKVYTKTSDNRNKEITKFDDIFTAPPEEDKYHFFDFDF